MNCQLKKIFLEISEYAKSGSLCFASTALFHKRNVSVKRTDSSLPWQQPSDIHRHSDAVATTNPRVYTFISFMKQGPGSKNL